VRLSAAVRGTQSLVYLIRIGARGSCKSVGGASTSVPAVAKTQPHAQPTGRFLTAISSHKRWLSGHTIGKDVRGSVRSPRSFASRSAKA